MIRVATEADFNSDLVEMRKRGSKHDSRVATEVDFNSDLGEMRKRGSKHESRRKQTSTVTLVR